MNIIYTITPEQEKAALNEALRSMMWNEKFKSLVNQSLLLSDILSKTNMTNADKVEVVADALSSIIEAALVNEEIPTSCYKNFKSTYEKYANQNLFGAIGGLSLTTDHFHQMMLDSSIYSYYKDSLFSTSMFFDFATKSDKFNKFLDDFISDDDNEYGGPNSYFPTLLLFPSIYKFTENKVQNIIITHQNTGNPGGMIFFAASPYTRSWLTKTNFIEEYKALISCGSAFGDDTQTAFESLSIAYQDLFSEDFKPIALEAIKEMDIKEFSSIIDKSDFYDQLFINLRLLELDYTPYSDDHYKYMISNYRSNSDLHHPYHLLPLTKSHKTKDLIIREDFTDCLSKNYSVEIYDEELNELSHAYQDLFGEELIVDTQSRISSEDFHTL